MNYTHAKNVSLHCFLHLVVYYFVKVAILLKEMLLKEFMYLTKFQIMFIVFKYYITCRLRLFTMCYV
jgi:hypothetical protein